MAYRGLTANEVGTRRERWHDLPLPLAPVAALAVATSAITIIAIGNPAPVFGGLLAFGLCLAVWSYPEIALVGLIVLVPFSGAFVLAVTHKGGANVGRLGDWKDALIVLLFVRGVLARRTRDGALRFPRGALPRFLIAYVLFYGIVAAGSPQITPALTALTRDIEGPLLFLAVICLRPSRRVLRACLFALVAGAVVVALAAVYEHIGPHAGFLTWYGAPQPPSGSSFYGASGSYRSGSFLDSPLTLAFYLAVSAPVALSTAFAFPRWRLFGVLAAAACVAGIFMTATRSGYIGGAVGLALVLAFAPTNRVLRTSLVGVFLIAVAAAYFPNQNNPQITRAGESAAKRSSISNTFNYVTAHPLGAGLGTIDAVGQKFGGGISSESTILAKGYEGGVAALLLYPATMLLLILFLLARRRVAVARGDPIQVGLAAGAVGATGAVLGAGIFLGVQELVVEVVVWGSAAIAVAWSLEPRGSAGSRASSKSDDVPGRTLVVPAAWANENISAAALSPSAWAPPPAAAPVVVVESSQALEKPAQPARVTNRRAYAAAVVLVLVCSLTAGALALTGGSGHSNVARRVIVRPAPAPIVRHRRDHLRRPAARRPKTASRARAAGPARPPVSAAPSAPASSSAPSSAGGPSVPAAPSSGSSGGGPSAVLSGSSLPPATAPTQGIGSSRKH